MANYIEAYENMISTIMEQYNKKNLDSNLDRQASYKVQNTDYYDKPEQERQKILNEARQSLSTEYRADASIDIEEAQNKLKRDHEKELNRIERLRLKAATGASQVTAYARANAMTESDAREELEQYAKVKTNGFSDSVIDRYAALRNRSKLEGQALNDAHRFYDEEVAKLGIAEAVKATKMADHYLSKHPTHVISEWNSSGASLYRSFKDKFKD
jgi:hypothetical protein